VIGLSLVESAYLAEIIRGGVLGVDAGQRDAARAMGFTPLQTQARIVLPQAMRMILPPAGSQFISVLKGTALVSVIAMSDLLHAVQVIYNRNYQIVPLLIVACIWYLALVTALTAVQRRVERRFARGHVREAA
jgi:polar amino acid transport system permease protein